MIDLDGIRVALAATAPVDHGEEDCRAAVALILRPLPGDVEALLIRRAERQDDPWSGHMGLPGGRREPADENALATALRETREEIGVDLRIQAELIGRLPTTEAVARGRRLGLRIAPFVFALPAPFASQSTATIDDRSATNPQSYPLPATTRAASVHPASTHPVGVHPASRGSGSPAATEARPLRPGIDPVLDGTEVDEVVWAALGPLLRGERNTAVHYKVLGQTVKLPAWDVQGRVVWGLTYGMIASLFALLSARQQG